MAKKKKTVLDYMSSAGDVGSAKAYWDAGGKTPTEITEDTNRKNAEEQKAKEWNPENFAKGAVELGKNIVAGTQQTGAKLADVAVKGGAVLENLFEQDNKKVQENLKRTEALRDVIKSGKDITGKSFAGTKDISAQEVMSDPRKAAELAGESLDIATGATMFANPASIVKNAAGETVKATAKQTAKQIAKEAGAFGAVDALAGGAKTYGETGDAGKAVTEGLKSGATSALTQGVLGGASMAAGKVLSKGKAKDVNIKEAEPILTDEQVTQFADELVTPKEKKIEVTTPTEEVKPEYLGSFRINKNSKKPVLNEEVATKLEAAKLDKDLPEHVYDQPTKVNTFEDVRDHPALPKNLRVAGQAMSERKRIIDEKINSLYKESDADIDKQALDLDYNKKMEQINKMPDIRAQIEAEKLDADYTQKLNDIEDRLANDLDETDKFMQVKDAVYKEELEFVNDVNAHLEIGNEKYRTINQERKQAYIDELTNQKYEIDPNPDPVKTDEILTKAVTSGEKLTTLADNNTAVQKAVSNAVEEAADSVNFIDPTNTGYRPDFIAKTVTGAKEWLPKLGDTGKKIGELLTEATEKRAIAQTKLSKTVKEWRKLTGGKIPQSVSKALDGDKDALASLSDKELKVYEQSRMYYDNAANVMADGYKKQIAKNIETIKNLDETTDKAKIASLIDANKELQSKVDSLTSDNRISSYLPHIIKKDVSKADEAIMQIKTGKTLDGKELTQDQLAKLQKEVAGLDIQTIRAIRRNSAYKIENGFLKKRTGQEGYSFDFEDIIAIYDRALNNELYMKPAFEEVKDLSKGLTIGQNEDLAQVVYNLGARPADDFGDQLNKTLDGIFGKENIGYDEASNIVRNAIYDSTMGFNFKSGLTNLSQNSNTIAKIGTGHWAAGMQQAVKGFSKDSEFYNELIEEGITTSTYSDFLSGNTIHNKSHDLMWKQFDATEKLNRAAAYAGGKSKFVADNMKKPSNEQLYGAALERASRDYGKKIAEKTQFKFDPMSTGINLQSTTAKNFTQFMSYNLNQVKFLKSLIVGDTDSMWVKNASGKGYHITPEGTKAVARYIGANAIYLGTIGALIGTSVGDLIPFYNDIMKGDMPQSPISRVIRGDKLNPGLLDVAGSATKSIGDIANVATGKGDTETLGKSMGDLGKNAADFAFNTGLMAVPGGTQLRKTIEGAKSMAEGQVTSDSGNIRYLQQPQTELGKVTDLPTSLILGRNLTSAGRKWTAEGMQTLSEAQTEKINGLPQEKKQIYLDYYMAKKTFPNKSEVLKKVKAKAESNPNAASRLIDKYNDDLNKASEKYYKKHEKLPEELLKEFDSLRINKLKYLD